MASSSKCAAKIAGDCDSLECPQGPEPDASGYKGFFYRFWTSSGSPGLAMQLSTIDSAFLFAGALAVATYFDQDTPDEAEIRHLPSFTSVRLGMGLQR